MSLKFSANLTFLFKDEAPQLTDRFAAAKKYGFNCVECSLPYDVPASDLKIAKEAADLEHVLINSFPGETFGLAAIPDRSQEFYNSLELSVKYAQSLECRKIHIMSGCNKNYDFGLMESSYLKNLRYAADRLQRDNILALIEPINSMYTIPHYFMNDPERAYMYVKELDHPNLKFQLDLYHEQLLRGNLTANMKEYWPWVGHVQVAQAPHRTAPDELGEIDYRYVFQQLAELKYTDWIGLEYYSKHPINNTISFLQTLGYTI